MKILLVEDSHDSRKMLSRFLDYLGHQVVECENGKDALNILKTEKIQTVFSDIRMPGIDGYQLLERIKKSKDLEDIIVVLFTGYADTKRAVEAMKNGAYDYLLKPINLEEIDVLTKKITEYLSLKQENVELTEQFEQHVTEATKDIEKELADIKKAYVREVISPEIGIFSDKLKQVFKTANKLHHNRNIPVLIEGETGTGKEIVARYIHYVDGDVITPFVGLNCAAISPELFESELFGYEPGAFTGGKPKGQKGKLELANGGTIFLDEISGLTPDFQAKLLRVIQEREFYRVGGLKLIKTDVRFICATNQDIVKNVAEGSFREDLYYRLNVAQIIIPPLRERKNEIIALANMFLQQLNKQNKTKFCKIDETARKVLENYPWPGNVRELKNTIERVVLLWDDTEIQPHHLDFLHQDKSIINVKKEHLRHSIDDFPLPANGINLNNWILNIVRRAIDLNKGNKTETARFLNISRKVLYTYIKNLKN